ncbi:MAG: hypothetical protein V4543_08495 [Bacteroidota bacterium]
MTTKSTAASFMRDKIAAIKANLPRNWRTQMIQSYPEYDSVQGSTQLSNWHLGRSANPEITERAEKLFKTENGQPQLHNK